MKFYLSPYLRVLNMQVIIWWIVFKLIPWLNPRQLKAKNNYFLIFFP